MQVLTEEAVEFVAKLHRAYAGRRDELLALRTNRRPLDFLPDTAEIRAGDWRVAEAPGDRCGTAGSRSPARPSAR